MNKIIPLSKDIHFKDQIGEIESIKIDNDLKFDGAYSINGNLIVSGSNLNQNGSNTFSYPLPVEIAIDSKYDTQNATIVIDDFYYEIINEDILRVNIDLCLDDLLIVDEQLEKENRKVDFDIGISKKDDLIDANLNVTNDDKNLQVDFVKDDNELGAKLQVIDAGDNKTKDLFKELPLDKEYTIYRVYTFLENDTIDSILSKYNITKDELEMYNDLSKIKPGMKVIIPSLDE